MDQTQNRQILDHLTKDDVASVSANGVSVVIKSGADRKAAVEAQMLENRMKYNPLVSRMPQTWGSMRK